MPDSSQANTSSGADVDVDAALLALREAELAIRAADYEAAYRFLQPILRNKVYPALVQSRALVDLAEINWRTGQCAEALDHCSEALPLCLQAADQRLLSRLHTIMGIAYKRISDYVRSLSHFFEALTIDRGLDARSSIGVSLSNVGSVYHEMEDYPRALEYYKDALVCNEETGNRAGLSITLGNLCDLSLALQSYHEALDYALRSAALDAELGTSSRRGRQFSSMGSALAGLGDYDQALRYYRQAVEEHERIGNFSDAARDHGNIGALYAEPKASCYSTSLAEQSMRHAIELARKYEIKLTESQFCRSLAQLLASMSRFEEAYTLMERHIYLQREISGRESMDASLNFDYQYKNAEREKILAVERTRFETTRELIHSILPPTIADRIMRGEQHIADNHSQVSVLFLDIVNFSSLAQREDARWLVSILNIIFSELDALAEREHLEKIKTIGDAYMATGGLSDDRQHHPARVLRFACAAIALFATLSKQYELPISARVGIHCGEVVAGVIGTKKYAYDLWGDAVNTASRMESHGAQGRVHVSEEFLHALENCIEAHENTHATKLHILGKVYRIEARGEIEVKGKGSMRTYFIDELSESALLIH